MRTIYYMKLYVDRLKEDRDVEFATKDELNVALKDVFDADTKEYMSVGSGEREVPFHHRIVGGVVLAEFYAETKFRADFDGTVVVSAKEVEGTVDKFGTTLKDASESTDAFASSLARGMIEWRARRIRVWRRAALVLAVSVGIGVVVFLIVEWVR